MAAGIYNFGLSEEGLKSFFTHLKHSEYERRHPCEDKLLSDIPLFYEEGTKSWHFSLSGSAGTLDRVALREVVARLVRHCSGEDSVLIDCHMLESINSAGLTALLHICVHIDGQVVLKNVTRSVRTLLDISGLDRLVTVLPVESCQ